MGDVVSISPLNVNASQAYRVFCDTFNRSSGRVGFNWVYDATYDTPFQDTPAITFPRIGLNSDGAQGLQVLCDEGFGTTNNYLLSMLMFCVPLCLSRFRGKNQFSRLNFVSQTGTQNSTGPAVGLINQNIAGVGAYSCYYVGVTNGNNWSLIKRAASVATTLLGPTAFTPPADIELRIQFGSPNALQVLVAGVQVGSTTDAAAIAGGIPGIFGQSGELVGIVSQTQWKNFCGGLFTP